MNNRNKYRHRPPTNLLWRPIPATRVGPSSHLNRPKSATPCPTNFDARPLRTMDQKLWRAQSRWWRTSLSRAAGPPFFSFCSPAAGPGTFQGMGAIAKRNKKLDHVLMIKKVADFCRNSSRLLNRALISVCASPPSAPPCLARPPRSGRGTSDREWPADNLRIALKSALSFPSTGYLQVGCLKRRLWQSAWAVDSAWSERVRERGKLMFTADKGNFPMRPEECETIGPRPTPRRGGFEVFRTRLFFVFALRPKNRWGGMANHCVLRSWKEQFSNEPLLSIFATVAATP